MIPSVLSVVTTTACTVSMMSFLTIACVLNHRHSANLDRFLMCAILSLFFSI